MDRFRNFGSQLRATATLLLALASPLSVHAAVDAWPLLEIDEDTTTVLYPLYVDDGDFQMVFPLYYRTNEGRDHHAVHWHPSPRRGWREAQPVCTASQSYFKRYTRLEVRWQP